MESLNNLDQQDFMGLNGFVWWYGVVEDRKDPLYLGRVKVRCIGFHTDDKELIPTDDLPWAQVIQPITSAAISGIGSTPTGPVEGTHVFGFFRDGRMGQEPVVIGTTGGIPGTIANPERGFFDPRSFAQRAVSPYPPLFIDRFDDGRPAQVLNFSTVPTSEAVDYVFEGRNDLNGKRLSYTVDSTTDKVVAKIYVDGSIDNPTFETQAYSAHPDENRMFYDGQGNLIFSMPSTNFLATARIKLDDYSIPEPTSQIMLATHRIGKRMDEYARVLHSGIKTAFETEFSQPRNYINPEYPFNHVTYSESGHLFEMDDTPGFERVRLMHRSQTFLEIDSDGHRIDSTVGMKYNFVDSNSYSHIVGTEHVTIGGGLQMLLNTRKGSDSKIKVRSGGNFSIEAENGNVSLEAKGEGEVKLRGNKFRFINNFSDVNENRDFVISGSNFKVFGSSNTFIRSSATTIRNDGDFSIDTGAYSVNSDGSLSLLSSDTFTVTAQNQSKETVTGKPFLTAKTIQALTGNIQIEATTPTNNINLDIGPFGATSSLSVGIEGLKVFSAAGNADFSLPLGKFESSTLRGVTFSDGVKIDLNTKLGAQVKMGALVSIKNEASSLKQVFDKLIDAILQMNVPTGSGPSGTAINAAQFQALKTEIGTFLE